MTASYDVQLLIKDALGIRKRWRLDRVFLNKKESRLRVEISFDESVEETCPLCGDSLVNRSGYTSRMWCHLNFFQYATYVTVIIPIFRCNSSSCVVNKNEQTIVNTLFLDVLLMVYPFDIKQILGTLLACSSGQRIR